MRPRRSACRCCRVIVIGPAHSLTVFFEACSDPSCILPVCPGLRCLSAGFQPSKEGFAFDDGAQSETSQGRAFTGRDQIVQVLPRHLEAISGLVNRESNALGVFAIHVSCPRFVGFTDSAWQVRRKSRGQS